MARLPTPKICEVDILPPDQETEARKKEFLSLIRLAMLRRQKAETESRKQ